MPPSPEELDVVEADPERRAVGALLAPGCLAADIEGSPRDMWCAGHKGDEPPTPYDFGTATAYGYRY